jgi:hypothetical protein
MKPKVKRMFLPLLDQYVWFVRAEDRTYCFYTWKSAIRAALSADLRFVLDPIHHDFEWLWWKQ